MMEYPKISILIPTLNAEGVLEDCLKSIEKQGYPKDRVEIIIADGGSTDKTLEIAEKYGARVFKNKLKTGESGKKVALANASGKFCALVDSDNILPTKNWLEEMVAPLTENPEALGSEPWEYTWRKKDGFITRYCALIGMNDPLVHFLGNYDRINLLTGKWTEISHEEVDKGDYLLVKFGKGGVPTIGANGTVFRRSFLKENVSGNYLFDIDILYDYLKKYGSVVFIKVKNGIIHTYCERNVKKFAKKQRRRVKDFLYHRSLGDRGYDLPGSDILGIVKFILICLTIFPLLYHVIKGYSKKKDIAWFFHPLACWITLWEYGWGCIFGVFKKGEVSRKGWGQ
jgi:glycosyltransferase involved in cell wall biosynthesis